MTQDERWALKRAWLAGFRACQKLSHDFTTQEMDKAVAIFLTHAEFPVVAPKEAPNGSTGIARTT